MSKAFTKKVDDDELRPEYDLTQLKGGVRGKYYKRAIAGTNLVLIEPDLAKVFPDADSVIGRCASYSTPHANHIACDRGVTSGSSRPLENAAA